MSEVGSARQQFTFVRTRKVRAREVCGKIIDSFMYNKDDFPCNKKLKSHMIYYYKWRANGSLDEAVFLVDGSKLDRLLRRILVD